MIRLALLAAVGLATLGCSTSRKVVIQNGYPGVQPPPGFEARPAAAPPPGPMHYTPEASKAVGPADQAMPNSSSVPTNL